MADVSKRQDAEIDPVCVDIPPFAATVPKWHSLEFPVDPENEFQIKTNWCWAAVARNVAHYYDPKNPVSQCEVANGELRRNDCCSTKPIPPDKDDPCDVYGYLMSSLYRVGHFRKWTALQIATSDQLHEEIANKRPLSARIVWNDGGAHLILIVAYADKPAAAAPDQDGAKQQDGTTARYEVERIGIADPWWGRSDIDYRDFPTSYMNCGSWTDTYYTKP